MKFNTELVSTFRKHWSQSDVEAITKTRPYSTMSTSRARNILEVVRYVHNNQIPGDIVECGVFKGGNIAMCMSEMTYMYSDKTFWAYDTYEGVPLDEVTDNDMEFGIQGKHKQHVTEWFREIDGEQRMCYCGLDDVKANWQSAYQELHPGSDIPTSIKYIKGSVIDTIPETLPEQISFLLLDMDIEKPTEHVLPYLWPLVSTGGVVQVDDYNTFAGVQKVIDEFFADKNVYIHEIDYTAISIVKL